MYKLHIFVFHTLCRPDVVVTVFTLLLRCCSCLGHPDLLSCVLSEGFYVGQFFDNTVYCGGGWGGWAKGWGRVVFE
jgi:hypothetical protein